MKGFLWTLFACLVFVVIVAGSIVTANYIQEVEYCECMNNQPHVIGRMDGMKCIVTVIPWLDGTVIEQTRWLWDTMEFCQ